MQLNQPGDIVHDIFGEPQRGEPLSGQLGPDHLVVMEGHPAVRQPGTGPGLADVVQQRGQSQHQVTGEPVPSLQPDGLAQHGEAVLVDVFVTEMLVCFEPQPGHLRQHVLGHAGFDEQVDAPRRVGRQHQLGQLIGDPFGGNGLEQPGSLAPHGLAHVIGHGEAQLGGKPGGPQDAQRVVGKRLVRRPGRAQDLFPQRGQAAERIDQLMAGQPRGHRVDGEVPAAQVRFEGCAVTHLWLARPRCVFLAAVGGDLKDRAVFTQPDRAEIDPYGPHRVGPTVDDPEDFRGRRVGGQVQVSGLTAEKDIADRATDQGEFVTMAGEQQAELVGGGRHPPQQGRSGLSLLIVQRVHGAHRTQGSGIWHGYRG